MKLHIIHQTRYHYSQAVQLSSHYLYLHPREDELLHLDKFALQTNPDCKTHWMRDDCDNVFACAHLTGWSNKLEIRSEFTATMRDRTPLDLELKSYAENFPFCYEPLHERNLARYLELPTAETQTGLRLWLEQNFSIRPSGTLSFLFALNETLHQTLQPRRREEEGIQPALRTLAVNSGACRDYAVLLMEMLRSLGLAARFTSGYFYDPVVAGTPSCSMHAWVEVYLPGAGWKGLDPSTGLFCYDAYIPVAHAAVPESINPIQGSYFSDQASHALSVDLSVKQLPEEMMGGQVKGPELAAAGS